MEHNPEHFDITPTMIENVRTMRSNLEEVLNGFKEMLENISERFGNTENTDAQSINILKDMGYIEDTIKDLQKNCYLVKKNDLEQICREVNQLKDLLPKIVNKDLIQAPYKLHLQELELKSLGSEKKELKQSIESLQSRQAAVLTELDREKQSNLALKKEIQDVVAASIDQSLYCTKLGSVTCHLLWNVSQQEENISKMFGGENGFQFLNLVKFTLDSYVTSLHEGIELKESTMEESELEFVFMLTGFVTNISASTFGRDYLVSQEHGTTTLMNTLVSLIEIIPLNKQRWVKLRNLILKIIYNLSLSEKGFSYFCSKKCLFKTLAMIIEEEKLLDNRLQSIRIIRSMLLEPNVKEVQNNILDLLPVQKLKNMVLSTRSKELQNELRELISDLREAGAVG